MRAAPSPDEIRRQNLAVLLRHVHSSGPMSRTTLAERMGRPVPEGIEIPIHLTRQEVAQMVGTTVESAIRVLSRWGRDGILVSGDKRFVLPSRERLAALCAPSGEPAS